MEKNIPKLRFPEFEGEWEKQPIGTFIDLLSGYAFKGDEISEDNNGIPLLRGINISEGFIRHNSEIDRFYTGDLTKLKKYLLEVNDLVIGMDGSKVGKNVALISSKDKNSLLIQRVARIRSNRFSDIKYIYQHIFSNLFRDYVDVVNTSSGIPHISAQQIKDFVIGFPSLPEQAKIANFLSAVDDKINQLKKKKDLLEKYKKGVMQKIFSQEIRFKDDNGQEFPEWEEKKLGDIGETYNGLTGKSKDNFGQGKPYIQYKQIFDDTKIDISRFDYVEINGSEKQNKVKFGDIFFTVSSETPEEVGMSSVLLNDVDELYLNSFCFGYRPSSLELLNPFYARFLFRSELFRKEVILLAQGSTRYNLSKVGMMKIKISLPSHPEQTKIANFLSAIDNKISHCDKHIEKMEGWKKGLLQQMFV